MGVKPGYKQTEIGVIPEDWGLICYADYLNIISGIGFKKSEYCDIGIRLLRIDNVSYGQISWDSIAYLPFQYTKKFPNLVLLEGDILLALNRPITSNQLKLARMNAEDSPAILYQRVGKIEVINRKLNKKFAYFVLRKYVRKFVEESSVGSDQPFVSTTKLKKICIPLPPLPEQTVIATALSDADALIQSLERLIAKKRDIKQGAMQELLIPKDDWVEKNLGRTAILKARIGWQGLTTAEYLDSGDYYLVTGTDFKEGHIDWNNCHFVDMVRYMQDINIQLQKNDVLVTKDGTIGKVALIHNLNKPATLNSGVFVIRPIDNVFDPKFFYYLLLSYIFTDFLTQLSAGSTITHIYQKDFVNFNYRIPTTIDEQTAIATILNDMDAEITALDSKLTKARQIKQGMMQELLTGRIRLT